MYKVIWRIKSKDKCLLCNKKITIDTNNICKYCYL